ncbi:MAG: sensor domain-containing diguanylate cyclase [Fimbriimonadales bacterium]
MSLFVRIGLMALIVGGWWLQLGSLTPTIGTAVAIATASLIALTLLESKYPTAWWLVLLSVLSNTLMLGVAWWLWTPPRELFSAYLLLTLFHLWRYQRVGGALSAFSVPAAFGLSEYARNPENLLSASYWMMILSLFVISALMVLVASKSRSPDYEALLQKATEEVERSEQAQRDLRSRFRELSHHYRRLEENMQALRDSDELYAILSRVIDPSEAYRLMLERLRAISEARGVALLLTEEGGLTLRVRCAVGSLRSLEGRQTNSPVPTTPNPPAPLQQIRTFLMTHLEQMEDAHSEESLNRSAILSFPIYSGEHLQGVVSFVSHPKQPFSSETERRLQALLPHLNALINLYDQIGVLEGRLQETQLVQELSSLLFTVSTAQSLPSAALEVLQPVLRFEYAQVVLIRETGYEEVANWKNMPDLRPYLTTKSLNPLWVADIQEQREAFPWDTGTVRSLILVPLHSIGRVEGFFAIGHSQPHFFTQTDYELAQSVGVHLAMILARANLLSHLEHLAFTDGLTGLYNHRYFQERYKAEARLTLRYQHPLALMMIDLDGFKQINDAYGHLEGDYVLVQLAEVLQQSLRNTELIARYGGDEFVVLLPSTNLQGAVSAAVRLVQAVAQHEFHDTTGQHQIPINISVGVAGYPDSCQDPALLLEIADSALERAKKSGRNRVVAIENTV